MHIVAVEDGVVIIHYIGDSMPVQKFFEPGWQPGEKFFFYPQNIISGTAQ
jgi:hypothetical protein